MPRFIRRLAAAALLALPLVSVGWLEARSGPATPGDPPEAVKQAIAKSAQDMSAAGDKSAEDKSAGDPAKVVVGAYINDIQQLDFKANNYAVDLYVWFRWKGADIDPSKTMEFMNRYASDDNLREELYDKPSEMPDGSLYAIIRYQGKFSTNFALESYPFDKQFLTVVMEDSVSGAGKQVYVPDGTPGVSLDPQITLPGFRVGKPTMAVETNTYPTNFGDLSEPSADSYSRLTLSVPVTRPVVAMSVKTFVPIALIVVCAALVFFVRPRYVEGRIGLGITALLTLVALQLTSGAALPDVDYLMMLDKIYLLAYLFIILALARVVATSWRGADPEAERGIARRDRIWAASLLAIYLAANIAIALSNLV